MNLVYDLFVIAHLLGMAAIVGGYGAVYFGSGEARVSEVMVWGARAQIITGIILVGMAESIDSLGKDPDHAKLGVKLVVALAVAAAAEIGRGKAKRGEFVPALTHVAGLLAILNVVVAAAWN
ncbi:hypothetical protein [Antrihabitans stalactiti]|uniref:Integral membrane protein n=1 Tax=Antrihabitans stalactiti TaxID=2584121 RepID=A0A848K9S5_9NOCA|nr:hypothetical protein [Antrihabitans stalactiti]